MTIAFLFWFLMLVWFLFGAGVRWRAAEAPPWTAIAGDLIPFLAVAVLGYAVLGSPIKG